MKRLAAVAMLVVGLTLPLCAQRAASHSSFAGHSSQTSHRTFSASAPRGYANYGLQRQAVSRGAIGNSLAVGRGWRGTGGGTQGNRRDDRRHYRREYVSPYGAGVVYGVPGWVNPYPLGYMDTTGTDDSQTPPDQSAAGDAGVWQAPPYDQGQQLPPYPPPSISQPAPAPQSEEAVTLVFKDGRPSEQIHNYVLTRTTLFVDDRQRREIPTDQLDLIATARVNQEAGVDFRLPDASR